MRVKFRSVLITVFLAAGGSFAAAASESDVEKLLASMRTAYQAAQTAQLKVKSRFMVGDEWITSQVAMSYAKPNRLRLEFTIKDSVTHRVSDGKKVYTWFDPETVRVKDVDPDALGNDAPINLECLSFFDWKRQLSTESGANMEKSKFKVIPSESWNGRKWTVLEESAHGQNVFVRYFIDPKTYFIWRCDVRDLGSRKPFMETEVLELTLNPKFDAARFRPPGKGS